MLERDTRMPSWLIMGFDCKRETDSCHTFIFSTASMYFNIECGLQINRVALRLYSVVLKEKSERTEINEN